MAITCEHPTTHAMWWDDDATLAVARNYYNRNFQPKLSGAGLRHLRELLTPYTVFDHLAKGQPKAESVSEQK